MTNKNEEFNFENFLVSELNKILPRHLIKESYNWAMFPAGKLFRPNLALAIFQDLNPNEYTSVLTKKNKDILFFACALECHHSYSLVHDDLPAMDNDDFRRGKESTHKKFGEWQAILTGDGLLNISYEFIGKISKTDPRRVLELLKLFSYSMGPRGLIHGQTLDLSHEMTINFENTITTHKLKTGRLIQMAILGSALLAIEKNRKIEKNLWRMGENIGILFQLLDDLSELADKNLSEHELIVNPWLRFNKQSYNETELRLKNLIATLNLYQLHNTNIMLADYFRKMDSIFKTNQNTIEQHLKTKDQLVPLMLLLDTLCHFN